MCFPILEYESFILLAVLTTALCVFAAMRLGQCRWQQSDFLNWNKLVKASYGNGILSGCTKMLRLGLKWQLPLITEEHIPISLRGRHSPGFLISLFSAVSNYVAIPCTILRKKAIVSSNARVGVLGNSHL